MAVWNPSAYLQFADERSRPFHDLTARITASAPRSVVDLGCGPGQLTAALARRWPGALVEGIDSSPEMIAAANAGLAESARGVDSNRLLYRLADVRAWRPAEPVDVIVSNATLQWIPGHRELLPVLVESLAPGGWLAFQVPGNFQEASHRLLHQLAADQRFAEATQALERPAAFDAASYLADLAQLDCTVDAWETTYLHVLTGPDAVFRWISATGARPVLEALGGELRADFETEYKSLLDAAYPSQAFGTVLPFRRIFVVAQRGSW